MPKNPDPVAIAVKAYQGMRRRTHFREPVLARPELAFAAAWQSDAKTVPEHAFAAHAILGIDAVLLPADDRVRLATEEELTLAREIHAASQSGSVTEHNDAVREIRLAGQNSRVLASAAAQARGQFAAPFIKTLLNGGPSAAPSIAHAIFLAPRGHASQILIEIFMAVASPRDHLRLIAQLILSEEHHNAGVKFQTDENLASLYPHILAAFKALNEADVSADPVAVHFVWMAYQEAGHDVLPAIMQTQDFDVVLQFLDFVFDEQEWPAGIIPLVQHTAVRERLNAEGAAWDWDALDASLQQQRQ